MIGAGERRHNAPRDAPIVGPSTLDRFARLAPRRLYARARIPSRARALRYARGSASSREPRVDFSHDDRRRTFRRRRRRARWTRCDGSALEWRGAAATNPPSFASRTSRWCVIARSVGSALSEMSPHNRAFPQRAWRATPTPSPSRRQTSGSDEFSFDDVDFVDFECVDDHAAEPWCVLDRDAVHARARRGASVDSFSLGQAPTADRLFRRPVVAPQGVREPRSYRSDAAEVEGDHPADSSPMISISWPPVPSPANAKPSRFAEGGHKLVGVDVARRASRRKARPFAAPPPNVDFFFSSRIFVFGISIRGPSPNLRCRTILPPAPQPLLHPRSSLTGRSLSRRAPPPRCGSASLVRKYGLGKWSTISKNTRRSLRQTVPRAMAQPRASRHHARAWSEEEERTCALNHGPRQPRWAEIANDIPGRTENAVKNPGTPRIRRKANRYSLPDAVPERCASTSETGRRSKRSEARRGGGATRRRTRR